MTRRDLLALFRLACQAERVTMKAKAISFGVSLYSLRKTLRSDSGDVAFRRQVKQQSRCILLGVIQQTEQQDEIRAAIAAHMKSQGLSSRKMAPLLMSTQSHLVRWLRGERHSKSIEASAREFLLRTIPMEAR